MFVDVIDKNWEISEQENTTPGSLDLPMEEVLNGRMRENVLNNNQIKGSEVSSFGLQTI